jgi:hypothetical protein
MLGVVRPGLYSAQGRVLACEPRETAAASGDLLPYARNGFPSWCKAQKEGGARGSFGGRSQVRMAVLPTGKGTRRYPTLLGKGKCTKLYPWFTHGYPH